MDFKGYSKLFEVVFVYNMSLLKQKMFLVLGGVKFWVQGFLRVLLEALRISLSFNFAAIRSSPSLENVISWRAY